jgi:hypothetical protein
MEPQFFTFRRFNEPALAKMLTAVLDENDIEYEVEDNSVVPNPLVTPGDELGKEYCIKLQQQNFDKVNALVLAAEEQAINEVEDDYYLFSFSDEELKDIVANADEWNAFDFALARKILKDRGIDISAAEIEKFRQYKLDALKKPDEPQTFWIVAGYFFAFFGTILGLFIGWFLSTHKKTLPNGERIYGYSESDRKHGRRIFRLSAILLSIAFILRILTAYLRG